jgi:hypothetical protein
VEQAHMLAPILVQAGNEPHALFKLYPPPLLHQRVDPAVPKDYGFDRARICGGHFHLHIHCGDLGY